MFNILDTKTNNYISTFGWLYKCNANKIAQSKNVKVCGIEEIDKPKDKRRFIVVER